MALAFARRGFVVFNINYRLAPAHRYPAAIEDVCAAYEWIAKNAEQYGGDPSQVVLAGESAGGNLAVAGAIATCFERPEPWARRVLDLDHSPVAVLSGCPILEVSNVDRYVESKSMPNLYKGVFRDLSWAYLGGNQPDPAEPSLADPILILESDQAWQKPLPPIFGFVGTKDPLKDEVLRLGRALKGRDSPHRVESYAGGTHAFHAFVFNERARRCWVEQFDFLRQYVDVSHAPDESPAR